MKLGIVAVYLVSEDNEKLLDIHLKYIQKYTKSEYTIYAGINMLLPRYREKLNGYEFIKSFEFEPYVGPYDARRGSNEHSYYLENLVQIAIGDKIDYLVIMHPDSFPVRNNWDIFLSKLVKETEPIVSIFPQMSACTFFSTEFFTKYNPKLLPNEVEEGSKDWSNFQKLNKPNNLIETGMGFAFNAFQNGLIWKKLEKNNNEKYHHHFGGIYGDTVFHLGSSSMYNSRPMSGYNKDTFLNKQKRKIISIIPQDIKIQLKSILPNRIVNPEAENNRRDYLKIRELLLSDSEVFINSIKR